jgi:hypothetical protein
MANIWIKLLFSLRIYSLHLFSMVFLEINSNAREAAELLQAAINKVLFHDGNKRASPKGSH